MKYHRRVLLLLPGVARPSYAGLRLNVLERAHGELMIRYQGEAVDYQEGPPPSSALWGAASACSPGPELQGGADGGINSHLSPNPPMGGVKAGQIGMREPTREKAWAPLGPM